MTEVKGYDLTKIYIPCALAFETQKAEINSEKKEWRKDGFGSVFITFCELLMLFCD